MPNLLQKCTSVKSKWCNVQCSGTGCKMEPHGATLCNMLQNSASWCNMRLGEYLCNVVQCGATLYKLVHHKGLFINYFIHLGGAGI